MAEKLMPGVTCRIMLSVCSRREREEADADRAEGGDMKRTLPAQTTMAGGQNFLLQGVLP